MLGVYYLLFFFLVVITALGSYAIGHREGVSETLNNTLSIGEEE